MFEMNDEKSIKDPVNGQRNTEFFHRSMLKQA